MNEDRLLNDLGDLARRQGEAEKERLDERWDRLAAGVLSSEEKADLSALAEASPEAREAYEAFRPLGAEFQARVVAAATAELARGPAPEKPLPRLLPFRRAAARFEVWLGTAAMAAAALFLLLRTPGFSALPVYTAELSGGTQAVRGGEPGPAPGVQVFVPGSLLTLTVRPERTVEGALEARSFLASATGAGEILPWNPEPRFEMAGGSVRLRGTLGREIRLPPGTWRIWVVVGRPDKLPSASELASAVRAGRTRQAAWQAVSVELRVDQQASP